MSSLTLTIIQTPLVWEDKTTNLAMLEAKINSIEAKTELVILPEMFNTGFSMQPEKLAEKMDGETISWMKRIAAAKKIILAGSLMIEEDGNYFNRLIWMLPNGQVGTYDKHHLFAYAGEHEKFSPGTKRLIASVKGWKINLQICYDLRFPVWSRQSPGATANNDETTLEYDLLIYVANWPSKRSIAWNTLLRARAIENQCFVAGVNRIGEDGNGNPHAGDSAVIDPLGEILYSAESRDESYTITLEKTKLEAIRQNLPFWKDADPFLILKEE